MRTLLIIPSSHIARQLITRIQSWQIVSTKVHLLKYIFAHYHHIEMLPWLFPCIWKGLHRQIPKENQNKHFSPICRIGSNAASVWVLGRVIVGEIPSGADFHPDSQMLSSTNTQCSAAETTVFPSEYFSVFPLKYILYFWRNSARCSVCVCRNPHLAISPPAEEIDRKGGGEDLCADPAAALISDANSGAEISNEIPPRYRQSDWNGAMFMTAFRAATILNALWTNVARHCPFGL